MNAPDVVGAGSGPSPREGLLTALAALKSGLEALPDPQDPGFYPDLQRLLALRVPEIHAAYDRCVTDVLITEGRKPTCSRTCSACCRHFVASVEPFELLALDAHLKARPEYPETIISNHRKSLLYEDLLVGERKRGAPEEEADDRATYRYFLKGVPCTFLEADGSCGVYDHRPMACRMFFAESPPRFCAGKALASPWNRNFQVEMPQEIEEALARCSRLLENLELPDGLFPGLVAVNALFGRYDAASGFPPKD
jgi:Fe-S-cluster containining protein